MSRHPQPSSPSNQYSKIADEYICFVAQHATPKAISLDDIKTATVNDPTLQHLTKSIRTGNWTVTPIQRNIGVDPQEMNAYFKLRNEITVSNENYLLLKGTRIILPAPLRSHELSLAHEGHQGLVKTKRLLRGKVWFPGIDAQAKSMIEKCIPCQAATPTKHHEPLQMTKLPDGPWQKLSADFCGPLPTGDYLLVVIDEYSRYPEVEILKSTSAKATIPKFDKILSTHGIPIEIKTDNGPPFNSQEFKEFSEDLGFSHRKITPLWPKANAEAERFMRTLNKAIITAHTEQLNWK
jgi:transposase InsO family protein